MTHCCHPANVWAASCTGWKRTARISPLHPLTQIKTKGYERADQLANLRSCSISIQDNAPLFMNRTEQLFMAWKRYCAANGMSPVNLYELRHTFVSLAKRLPEGLV